MEKRNCTVLGLQWGDEGKGKIIDYLAKGVLHVARAQGGNNAGHTVLAEGKEYAFHLIPSGILYPHVRCYIGGGVVLDPRSFLQEIERLESEGLSLRDRLFVSRYAHLVLPSHQRIDALEEGLLGDNMVGTTKKGIGPCYADRASRKGIRVGDWVSSQGDRLLQRVLEGKNREIRALGGEEVDVSAILHEYRAVREKLVPYVAPVEELLWEACRKGEKILFEGAQGALLDTAFGTYPFVTSSCTLVGGICTGLQIPPREVGEVIGVVKAYATRVGSGPFPTEFSAQEYQKFPSHTDARERGTTTGRNRRIGWLDIPLLRQSIAANGVDSLALMKLDVLDSVDEIFLCTGYRGNTWCPMTQQEWEEVSPVYESHAGWKSSLQGISSYEALPKRARAYLERIVELVQVPLSFVSVGPNRSQTLCVGEHR